MLNSFTSTGERKTGLVAAVPLQREGKPDEIANAIVFLASDKSSHHWSGAFRQWKVGGLTRNLDSQSMLGLIQKFTWRRRTNAHIKSPVTRAKGRCRWAGWSRPSPRNYARGKAHGKTRRGHRTE